MAYKILGQIKPAGTTESTLYTVPGGKTTVVSTITVTSITSNDAFRIYILPSGESSGADNRALVKDYPIANQDMISFTLGVTLGAGDLIRVYTSSGNVTFMAFGNEI